VRPVWLAVPAAAYPAFFAVVPAGPSPGAARVGSAAFAAALLLVVLAYVQGYGRGPGGPATRPPARTPQAGSTTRPGAG
jgi:hypothetical protein